MRRVNPALLRVFRTRIRHSPCVVVCFTKVIIWRKFTSPHIISFHTLINFIIIFFLELFFRTVTFMGSNFAACPPVVLLNRKPACLATAGKYMLTKLLLFKFFLSNASQAPLLAIVGNCFCIFFLQTFSANLLCCKQKFWAGRKRVTDANGGSLFCQ